MAIPGEVIHEDGWSVYAVDMDHVEAGGLGWYTLPLDQISGFDLKTGDVFYIAVKSTLLTKNGPDCWSLAEEGGIPGVPEWAGYQKFTIPPISYDIFVDDVDAEFEGAWGGPSVAVSGYYGTGYRYRWAGSGSNTATWPFHVLQAGSWEVFAKWTSGSNRATNAPYTINHADGSSTVRVNQENNGGEWVSLGIYGFNEVVASIFLTDDADDVVIADAVMLVRARYMSMRSWDSKLREGSFWNTTIILGKNLVTISGWPFFSEMLLRA